MELTIIGYFMEKKISYGPITKRAMEIWAKHGLVEVKVHMDGFFLRFDREKGFNFVLNTGPWKMFDQYVYLKRGLWSLKIQKGVQNC